MGEGKTRVTMGVGAEENRRDGGNPGVRRLVEKRPVEPVPRGLRRALDEAYPVVALGHEQGEQGLGARENGGGGGKPDERLAG